MLVGYGSYLDEPVWIMRNTWGGKWAMKATCSYPGPGPGIAANIQTDRVTCCLPSHATPYCELRVLGKSPKQLILFVGF